MKAEVAEKLTDYYKILQVDPEADPDIIEAAYKRLARKYHPDLNKAPDANQRMMEINLAYEVLGDPQQRAEYHQKWQEKHGNRTYGGEFVPHWFAEPLASVTLAPTEVRFERVPHGQAVEADVMMSLSRSGRFHGEMMPHQSWLKAKVVGRRKGAVVIRVTVDTATLRGGVTYEGSVAINSLMYGTVLIPVRVSVAPEPRPLLKTEPAWLDAGTVRRSNEPVTMILRVRNVGSGKMEGEIRVKHGWLSAEPDQFAGSDTQVSVTLTPATLKPGRSYTGKVEVISSGGVATVPVKVMVQQELPNFPPPDSDEYWPAVLVYLKPQTTWEKDFVAQMKALSQLRGWRPAGNQQSTILHMLSRDME